ncbi:MAG: acetylserotonin O-methyltransferase [Acidobacteriota bacterium]|nr:acetylserotonin O-methyltransferase [Acidobacteriota bacterium]
MNNENGMAMPQLPPEAVLPQMILGGLMQKSIWVAAKLGIADFLVEEPRTAEELAAVTDTHAPSLYRVLRLLATAGIFAETPERKFELTPIAELLRGDAPRSMRDYAIMMGEDWIWQAYGELMYSVKTGGIAHDKVQGMSSFEFYAQNEEAGKVFNRAMTNLSLLTAPAIVEGYDFSGIGKLVDIAGGHGLLLAAILKANPHLRGVLFDLPFVIEGASELLESEGVAARTEKVSGDFFESVPAGADAYMMKHIIHDWDDQSSIKILQNIHWAMNEDGKVLIVEMVVPEGNEPSPAKGLDLVMLTIEGGKERTAEEYRELLAAAGLSLSRIIPTRSPYGIVEAVKT